MKLYCLKEPEGILVFKYLHKKKAHVIDALNEEFTGGWEGFKKHGHTIVPVKLKEITK